MSLSAYRCTGCGTDFEADEPRCPQCLKKSTVEPRDAAKAKRSPAERHLSTNLFLMVMLAAGHFLFLLSTCINVFLAYQAAHGGGLLAEVYETHTAAEKAGQVIAFACVGVWAAGGAVWTPLNAWALSKRKPWARSSCLLYWALTLVVCPCMPLGVYGLYSLTRKEVKDLLSGPPAPAAADAAT